MTNFPLKSKYNKNSRVSYKKGMSLFEAVNIAALSSENSCRVTEEGSCSVIVYDCSRWDKENNALLLFLKPHVDITIISSINSLSGFKIIISEQKNTSIFKRVVALIITITLFVICFFNLISLPFK
jgi:hypothetical protein